MRGYYWPPIHKHANGLGNDNDNVGRYFMEHLELKSAELHLARPNPLKLYALDFGVTKARAELAITKEKQEEHKILNGTVSLTPLEFTKNLKPMIEIWKDDDPRKNPTVCCQLFKRLDRRLHLYLLK
jgi:hypothetical protein